MEKLSKLSLFKIEKAKMKKIKIAIKSTAYLGINFKNIFFALAS